jgi:hypothetical protein
MTRSFWIRSQAGPIHLIHTGINSGQNTIAARLLSSYALGKGHQRRNCEQWLFQSQCQPLRDTSTNANASEGTRPRIIGQRVQRRTLKPRFYQYGLNHA